MHFWCKGRKVVYRFEGEEGTERVEGADSTRVADGADGLECAGGADEDKWRELSGLTGLPALTE